MIDSLALDPVISLFKLNVIFKCPLFPLFFVFKAYSASSSNTALLRHLIFFLVNYLHPRAYTFIMISTTHSPPRSPNHFALPTTILCALLQMLNYQLPTRNFGRPSCSYKDHKVIKGRTTHSLLKSLSTICSYQDHKVTAYMKRDSHVVSIISEFF